MQRGILHALGLIAIGAMGLIHSLAPAQEYEVRRDMVCPNGFVLEALVIDDTIYIGGDFQQVGWPTGGLALLDGDTAEFRRDFPRINGRVDACIPDGLGGCFLGGKFSRNLISEHQYIIHILADGTVDPDWYPQFNDVVNCLALSGETLFVGGEFTHAAGSGYRYLAAVNAHTGSLINWNSFANGPISDMVLGDSTLYVTGDFSTVGRQSRSGLAAINANTGEVEDWYPGPMDGVLALELVGTTLYVGGNFTDVGGLERNHLAAFDTQSDNEIKWTPAANGPVRALLAHDDRILVGGDFTTINGEPRAHVASLDMQRGAPNQWNPAFDGPVHTLAINGDSLFAAGNFTAVEDQPRRFAASVDVDSGVVLGWDFSTDGRVLTLLASGEDMLVGGEFTIFDPVDRQSLAAINANTGELTDWNPSVEGQVYALAVHDSKIYLGGRFARVGGTDRNAFAAVDRDTGELLPLNPGFIDDKFSDDPYSVVADITVQGDDVYMAVNGAHLPGNDAFSVFTGSVVYLDTISEQFWLLRELLPDYQAQYSTANSIAINGNDLYVGGTFAGVEHIAEQQPNLAHIPLISGRPWDLPSPSLGNYQSVNSLDFLDGRLYVGGRFDYLTPPVATRNKLYSFWFDPRPFLTEFSPTQIEPIIFEIDAIDQAIYTASTAGRIGDIEWTCVAAFDPITGANLGWNPPMSEYLAPGRAYPYSTAYSILASGEYVLVGGIFGGMDGVYQPNFAILKGYQFPGHGAVIH